MSFTRLVSAISLVALALIGASSASAQEYPYRPIRILTNAAGGGTDFASRLIAPNITGPLGQPVIVDNRGGIVNIMATALKALPDGYTLMITGGGVWVNPLLSKAANWDMERDFSPITLISRDPLVLVVNPSVPANSVQELIALAKAKPGVLNYGQSGVGGPSHLAMELLNSLAGVKMTRIPFNGTPLVVTSLLTGEVQVTMADPSLAMPQVKAGKLRALGVSTLQPSPVVPGVPSIASTGLPGYEWIGATGMWAPAKTSPAIINRLNRETVRVLNLPEIKEKFLGVGSEVVAGTPEQFAAFIRSELVKSAKVIKEANIKID